MAVAVSSARWLVKMFRKHAVGKKIPTWMTFVGDMYCRYGGDPATAAAHVCSRCRVDKKRLATIHTAITDPMGSREEV